MYRMVSCCRPFWTRSQSTLTNYTGALDHGAHEKSSVNPGHKLPLSENVCPPVTRKAKPKQRRIDRVVDLLDESDVQSLTADGDRVASPSTKRENVTVYRLRDKSTGKEFFPINFIPQEYLIRTRRSKVLVRSLLAANLLEQALHLINPYFSRRIVPERDKKINPKGVTSVLNIYLEYLASKGDFDEMMSVIDNMLVYGIGLNDWSYVAVFSCGSEHLDSLCITQLEYARTLRLMKNCHSQMVSGSVSIDDIFFKVNKDIHNRIVKLLNLINLPIPGRAPTRKIPTLTTDLVTAIYAGDRVKRVHKRNDGCLTRDALMAGMKSQLANESSCMVDIPSLIGQGPETPIEAVSRKRLKNVFAQWREVLIEKIRDEKAVLLRKKTLNPIRYTAVFHLLEVEEFADILLDVLHDTSIQEVPMVNISHQIGKRIYSILNIRTVINEGIADCIEGVYEAYLEYFTNDRIKRRYLPREFWQLIERDLGLQHYTNRCPWDYYVCMYIGSQLLSIMINSLKFNTTTMCHEKTAVPVLYHYYSSVYPFRIRGMLKLHPTLVELIRMTNERSLRYEADILPMLCPPTPWRGVFTGGYLIHPCILMRYQYEEQYSAADVAIQNSAMLPVLDSLNSVAIVPWKMNSRILSYLNEVFIDGGNTELTVPTHPSSIDMPVIPDSVTSKDERSSMLQKVADARLQKVNMAGLYMEMLYRLSIANNYKDDVVWFPQNMDFRGRVYPVPPHFNHQGHDVARSMMLFSEGRRLGKRGMNWLLLHLANLTGNYKRISLDKRIECMQEKLPLIVDSAVSSFDGKRWWQQSEEPWQTLACCLEISDAILSGDPKNFVSHFPVHQDGSCNGLQHYAALGRDLKGAVGVNLEPRDTPQDIYQEVTNHVEKLRANDDADIAKHLEGFVERKIVKQTVMTTVYGVTKYGGHKQIASQLRLLGDFPNSHVNEAASYLVDRVFDSLHLMFQRTKDIRDWFSSLSSAISKGGVSSNWITPLGFPVIQPYYKTRHFYMDIDPAKPQNLEVMVSYNVPLPIKQKNAFPPNYIHSLDATHMMLTALYSSREGITFAAVHDCFWTHACSVDMMNFTCRQQFVRLHSEPLLLDLAVYISANIVPYLTEEQKPVVERILKNLPETGDFDLERVMDSKYFFC